MNLLYVIEIVLFLLVSVAIYFLFRKKKIDMLKCLAVVVVLFLIVLLQIVFFPFSNEPTINFKGGSTIEVEYGSEYDSKSVTAFAGFSNLTDKLKTAGEVNTKQLGEYTVRYMMDYEGKTYYSDRVIKIVDKTPPVIEFKEGNDFTATDNCDGNITNRVTVSNEKQNDGKYKMTYTVEDSSGNKATKSRVVDSVDTTVPEIKLNGNYVKVLIVGEEYTDEGCTANDDLDGNISSRVVSDCNGKFVAEQAGTFRIKYTVSDSANNKATTERVVKVINKVGYDSAPCQTSDGKGIICLTFDDGPGNKNTPVNLDTLKKYGVPATFFIINYSEDKISLLERMKNEGHTIALHAYEHDYSKAYASKTSYLESINKLHDKVLKDTGVDSHIIRFPGGASNMVSKKYSPGLMGTLPKLMLDNGYLYYDWNADSTDAETKYMKDSEAIYEHAISGIKQGRYNVLLMHDIDSKAATAVALPKIIQWGLDNGYKFEAITVDTPLVCHNANNV